LGLGRVGRLDPVGVLEAWSLGRQKGNGARASLPLAVGECGVG
jgi:hypothetical protein